MTERWLAWQKRCQEYARAHGYPNAEHVGRFPPPHSGDLLHVGDRIIECTTEPMSNLSGKLDQAAADATLSGFDEFWVWKTARSWPMAGSYMITRASVMWRMAARLDRLEQWEAEMAGLANDEFERGYQAGLKAAREGATA